MERDDGPGGRNAMAIGFEEKGREAEYVLRILMFEYLAREVAGTRACGEDRGFCCHGDVG